MGTLPETALCKRTVKKVYTLPAGSRDVGGNFLRLTVSEQGFYGTAKMITRSDNYKSKSNSQIAEYVIWSGSSSKPDYPQVNGDIPGVRRTYDPKAGTIGGDSAGKDGCYIRSGQKVCI